MRIIALFLVLGASLSAAEKPVHLFILSGQSNMARMNPNAGFMPEAGKLFKDEEVVYIKVSKGVNLNGQYPITAASGLFPPSRHRRTPPWCGSGAGLSCREPHC